MAKRRKGPTPRRPPAPPAAGHVADWTTAAAVALVTARRGGISDEEFGRMVATTVNDLLDAYPREQTDAVIYLVGQLTAQAAYALDQWDTATGGAPAADLLTRIGLNAARQGGTGGTDDR